MGTRTVGVVTPANPSLDVSEMTYLVLSAEGQLLRLVVVPPQVASKPETQPSEAWEQLFELGGLEIAGFTATAPEWASPVDSDRKAAWVGHSPGQGDVPLRVEAASYHGRPVFFDVQGPWVEATRMGPSTGWTIPTLRLALWAYVLFLLLALGGGGILARANLKRRRGDRSGALRLGGFVAAALTLAQLARADHVPRLFQEYHLVERIVTQALAWALLVGVGYLALEPLVRRNWPRTLTSWHRLLSGHPGDPMVGRDLLLGAVFGLGGLLLFSPPLHLTAFFDIAAHPQRLLHHILVAPFFAAAYAAGTLLVIQLIWLIVRRRWLAMLLAGFPMFLLAIGGGWDLARTSVLAVVFVAGWVVIVVRLGLLAATAAFFFFSVAGVLPPFSDPSVWYSGPTMVGAGALIATFAWAFHTSLGGRPVFGRSLGT
jgi:serine/threonine-protein kinase